VGQARSLAGVHPQALAQEGMHTHTQMVCAVIRRTGESGAAHTLVHSSSIFRK